MQTVSFRPVNGEPVKLDLPPTTTIGECRNTLAKRLGHVPAKVKLILRGRVLKDTDVISAPGIGPNDVLVLYAPKPTAAAQPPAEPPGGVDPAATARYEAAVMSLMDMGYARSDCQAAFRAAFGDLNRAAEFLTSGGWPDPVPDDQDAPEGAQARALLRAQPGILENIMRGITPVLSPRDAAAIRSRPDLFLAHIGIDPATFDQGVLEAVRNGTAQPIPDQPDWDPEPEDEADAPPPAPAEPEEEPEEEPDQPLLAQFTEDERAAVQRIAELGTWPLVLVVQIFNACDKNEMLAANLLLNNN
jgi:hypothetical protein